MVLNMEKGMVYLIGVVTVMAIFTIVPYVGTMLGDSNSVTERIGSVNVFFNDVGTDATAFEVAVYNEEGRKIGTTEAGEVLGDSWCTASFKTPVRVTHEEKITFLVSANGNFAIPGDETGIIEESISGYGAFPFSISEEGTGSLSIYASLL